MIGLRLCAFGAMLRLWLFMRVATLRAIGNFAPTVRMHIRRAGRKPGSRRLHG